MEQPRWVDEQGRVRCVRCGELRGYSYDRESGEPICAECQIASIDAAEAIWTHSGGANPERRSRFRLAFRFLFFRLTIVAFSREEEAS